MPRRCYALMVGALLFAWPAAAAAREVIRINPAPSQPQRTAPTRQQSAEDRGMRLGFGLVKIVFLSGVLVTWFRRRSGRDE